MDFIGLNSDYDYVSREKLEKFLFGLMEGGLVSDGVIAQDINQVSSFWRIREVCTCHLLVLFLIKTVRVWFPVYGFYARLI